MPPRRCGTLPCMSHLTATTVRVGAFVPGVKDSLPFLRIDIDEPSDSASEAGAGRNGRLSGPRPGRLPGSCRARSTLRGRRHLLRAVGLEPSPILRGAAEGYFSGTQSS
jgi:hypothetical protein